MFKVKSGMLFEQTSKMIRFLVELLCQRKKSLWLPAKCCLSGPVVTAELEQQRVSPFHCLRWGLYPTGWFPTVHRGRKSREEDFLHVWDREVLT